MDVGEDKYRRIINEYRPYLLSILSQSPFPHTTSLPRARNLNYLLSRAELGVDLPYNHELFEEKRQEIKRDLKDTAMEVRVLALRLAVSLPLVHAVPLLLECQNELCSVIVPGRDEEYAYEITADACEFLLSIYELTGQSWDIYLDVNTRITSLLARLTDASLSGDKESFRNGCEVLRAVFILINHNKAAGINFSRKLVAKIISILLPSSFVTNAELSQGVSNVKLCGLVLRVREYEVRMRARLYFGFCCVVGELPVFYGQLIDILMKEIFVVLENINECDVNLESFSCLEVLLQQQLPFQTRIGLMKRWGSILYEIAYKKEYLQYYTFLLQRSTLRQYGLPLRLRFDIAVHSLELTKNIQEQYTRFVLLQLASRNLIEVARTAYSLSKNCSILLDIFQYSWFIDRINQDHDLFKSQFAITLLHAFLWESRPPSKQEVMDLLALCHRLIDWRCSRKEETHNLTIKFAFDFYLIFLTNVSVFLGQDVKSCLIELVDRCNEPSLYFLFKLKLVSTLITLPSYKANAGLLESKLNLDFIDGEIRPFMMPKNPKPIFDFEYSREQDGEIESRKEIECIKIIMNLLDQLPHIHESIEGLASSITVDYHQYLSELEQSPTANKQLINCLQTLEGDNFLTLCHRNFLLSLSDGNCELDMENCLLKSELESYFIEDDINIFGTMSPVQLQLKLLNTASYNSVYLQIKKSCCVSTPDLKLVVSSKLQKKQVSFDECILELKIDRVGTLHFQVWTSEGASLLLGYGNYRVRRKLLWRKFKHFKIIDGIHTKAYFKSDGLRSEDADETYLSYYYGEPILIQLVKSRNEVVVGVSSRQIWEQMKEVVGELVEQLVEGTAEMID